MFGVVKEGLAKVVTKYSAEGKQTEVFYNQVQKMNRDLSVLVA